MRKFGSARSWVLLAYAKLTLISWQMSVVIEEQKSMRLSLSKLVSNNHALVRRLASLGQVRSSRNRKSLSHCEWLVSCSCCRALRSIYYLQAVAPTDEPRPSAAGASLLLRPTPRILDKNQRVTSDFGRCRGENHFVAERTHGPIEGLAYLGALAAVCLSTATILPKHRIMGRTTRVLLFVKSLCPAVQPDHDYLFSES